MVESNISANEENKFSVSLLAFWVKGSIIADKSFVRVDMPNTVLFGLIPAGKNKKNIPLQSISNAQESNWYKVANMFFGAIIAIAGFYMFGQSALLGLVLALLGIVLFLTGFKFRMSIERVSGMVENFDVPFFEAAKVRKVVEDVNNTVASYQDSQNSRDYGMQNTQAIINAINNQNQPQANMQQVPMQAVAGQNDMAANLQTVPVNTDNVANAKFCSNCGAKVDASAAFCTSCGNKLQ